MPSSVREKVRPHLGPVLLILAVSFAIYGGMLGHDFLINWDDDIYVTGNEAVRGFSLSHLRSAFTTLYTGHYAPMQIISYMLDYKLWGMRAFGFKLGNLLLHAANALLIHIWLQRFGIGRIASLCAALLFLVHPVQVESVAWISERKTVLAMFFFLLSLLQFDAYRERGGIGRYAGSLIFFVLALLSKSVAVVLPVALLLIDMVRQDGKRPRWWLADKVPFLLAAAATAVITYKCMSYDMGGGRVGYLGNNPLNNAMTMMPVFARYLGLLFWPASLSPIYKPPIKTAFDLEVLLCGALLALAVAGTLFLYRRQRLLFIGMSLFFLGLLPVSHIIPLATLMQDRYLYFPLLGVAMITGVALNSLSQPAAARAGLICSVVLLAVLGFLAKGQTANWRNSRALWSDTAVKVPGSREAKFFLAQTCMEMKDLACAEDAYLKLLVQAPKDGRALSGLGLLYGEMGDLAKSRQYFQKILELKPGDGDAMFNLGYNYYLAGDAEDASYWLQRALLANGVDAKTLTLLSRTSLRLKNFDETERWYHQAEAAAAVTGDMEFDMACARAAGGKTAEALQHFANALRSGFRDASRIRTEPLLAPLRPVPEFRRLVREYFTANEMP